MITSITVINITVNNITVVRFPKNKSSPEFEEATRHVLDSLVDAFIVSIVADTKK